MSWGQGRAALEGPDMPGGGNIVGLPGQRLPYLGHARGEASHRCEQDRGVFVLCMPPLIDHHTAQEFMVFSWYIMGAAVESM